MFGLARGRTVATTVISTVSVSVSGPPGPMLPLSLVMWRLVRRTVRRAATKEELWGTGNRETFRNSFLSRQSVLLWALKTHRRNRQKYAVECEGLAREKRVIRLQNKRQIERFVTAAA